MRFGPFSSARTLSEAEAITAASKWVGVPIDKNNINAQLLLSTVEDDAMPITKKHTRWVWRVTFSNLLLPPVSLPVGSSMADITYNTQKTIVIDARTGDFLQAYSLK